MNSRTINKFISFGLSLMLTFMTVLASPAQAQSPRSWTTVASAGVVDEADINDVSMSTAGVVQLDAGSESASATIRYNVVATDGLFDSVADPRMRVRFMDSGNNSQVLVTLYRVNLSTGNHSKLFELDSNDHAASNSFQTQTTANCAGTNFDFDFTNYAYYIEAKLIRSGSTGLAKLATIQLFTEQNAACHQ